MEYIIAVYRSRNVSTRAYNFLVEQGQTCALISTPQGAGVGCGLSVKFGRQTYNKFRNVLCNGETFVGFFLVKVALRGTTIVRI